MWRTALCCAAIVVAGCGSSKSDNKTNTSSGGGETLVQQPKPTQPISAVVPLFNKALKDQSCTEFAALDFSQTRQNATPGAPPAGTECKFFKQALQGSRKLRFTHGAEYGTAALLEGPAPKSALKQVPSGKKATSQALFILDRDGHYRFVFSNVDLEQIGTKPSAGAVSDHGRNAQGVVDAVRAGDCTKLVPLIHPKGSLAHSYNGDLQATCKAFTKGKVFAPAVRATKDPKAVLLGATRDFQFYGVATTKTYFTLVMVTPPGTSDKPPLLFENLANTDNPAIPKSQPG